MSSSKIGMFSTGSSYVQCQTPSLARSSRRMSSHLTVSCRMLEACASTSEIGAFGESAAASATCVPLSLYVHRERSESLLSGCDRVHLVGQAIEILPFPRIRRRFLFQYDRMAASCSLVLLEEMQQQTGSQMWRLYAWERGERACRP
jgi:hypothetical protein